MKRCLVIAAFLQGLPFAVMTSSVFAQMQASTTTDPRIRSLLYVPDQVVRVRGWVGFHVDLEFEPGESFVTLGGGDLAALSYGAYSNHLVLKPKAASVRTNLTVFTNKRTYVIDYWVSGGRPDPLVDELVYSLRFNYPPIPGPTLPEQITKDLAASPGERFQNVDYWYCGNSLLQPVAVSDDGVHTRLTFAAKAETIVVRESERARASVRLRMRSASNAVLSGSSKGTVHGLLHESGRS
jgi:type IV secretion system protein VirB9